MFYLKLALTNIKKNGKIYFPYLITSIFTVMMFYCVKFLGGDNGLRKDSESAAMMMSLGVYVVIIFSVIFLLYINSFLMKNRKKELGLYNILGMEKRHVMLIIFIETLIVYLISLGFGVLTGVLFSKLMMLISAFASREMVMNAYQEAIREEYRFFSFGDSMMLY